ncbi:MAG: glutamine amidotransferase [Propionibacteriaceae bacterium]|nr:glutamine amidotransferase [Propionibacteriaceae bacterium]
MTARPSYRLAWLYPDLLELYGDSGNITLLRHRCAELDVDLHVDRYSVGDSADLPSYDMVFLGGGSDREQQIFYADLMARKGAFTEAIESDAVVLTICGGYQLFGSYYQNLDGHQIDGLGIFGYHTIGAAPRTVGYLVEEATLDGATLTLAGFENHSGLTYGVDSPLARVLKGTGNNREDDTEGVSYRNLIGTYLHGPLLARNPELTDLLISRMARRRGHDLVLTPRASRFSQEAKNQVLRELGLDAG